MKGWKAALVNGSALWTGMLLIGLTFAYGNPADVILKATPEHFDAGTVPEGNTVEVTSSIQNIGSTPVEITSVKTS